MAWHLSGRSVQHAQANIHLDLGCIGKEPLRSGAAKPLPDETRFYWAIAFAGLLTIFTGKNSLSDLARHFSKVLCKVLWKRM